MNRSWTSIILTAFAMLPLAAPGTPARAQHREAMVAGTPEATLPEGVSRVTLPLRTVNDHIILPVSVNGSDPLPMILDTGMPMPGLLLFESDAVEALTLDFTDIRVQVGGAGGDGAPLDARMATGAKVGLGVAEIRDLRVIVMPPMPHAPMRHAGVIGAAIFRNFTVHVNYDAQEIVLATPGTFDAPVGSTTLPIDLKGNIPYIEARVVTPAGKEVPVNLVLDLGATHPVSLDTGSIEALELPAGAVGARIGLGVSGEVTGHVGRIPAFLLGGYRLENVVSTFPGRDHAHPRGMDGRDGNLGMGILNHFNLTFDYAAAAVSVKPNGRFSDPIEWDMSGLTLDFEQAGGATVAAVVPGSPAAGAGLRPGDVVVSVDGRPVTAHDGHHLRELFRREGAEVSLRLRREGDETTDVRFTLRRLI